MADSDTPAPPRRPQTAGGCLIAAGLLAGAAIGAGFHQASIGVLAGFAIGVIGAVLMTMRR